MTETLPPCPRTDCPFVASEANPTGHHWHGDNGHPDPPIRMVYTHVTEDVFGELCRNGDSDSTRCYSAHIPTEPAASLEGAPDAPSPVTFRDASTGQYVTAEHAAANPAMTVREDDSRVRELERRVGELQRRLDAVVALLDQGDR